jgi:hypothetical protein
MLRRKYMKHLNDFAVQSWVITPTAPTVGFPTPANIHDQQWLVVLSGVVMANLSGAQLHETLRFMPEMSGNGSNGGVMGPLAWAINRFNIPQPFGPQAHYMSTFALEEWTLFASVSSFFTQGQPVNPGFAVDTWRPSTFGTGIDLQSQQHFTQLFNGMDVDVAVQDAHATIYRIAYQITLVGKIIFVDSTTINPGDQKTVPDVEGSRLAQAMDDVRAAGLVPINGTPGSSGNWFVTQVMPPEGTLVAPNSEVTLHSAKVQQ